jgi:hypothetical protein
MRLERERERVDTADGFYRLCINPAATPELSVGAEEVVAFPL